MKLLFDQNLSHKLVGSLSDILPGSAHVRDLGMRQAADPLIWTYAKAHGFTLTSKDGDFHQLSLLHGAPPKVVWLRVGNASTSAIAVLLRQRIDAIRAFVEHTESSLLVLDR